MELPKGDKPGEGEGQMVIARVLRDQKKLLGDGDPPDAPAYVRDQTPLKTKGEISTQELRNEFRRAPKLSILLTDSPLVLCIRQGINSGVFIYREGDQLWGKDDPEPAIRVTENAFVHTLDDARKKKLWPRPEPLSVKLTAFPPSIKPGQRHDADRRRSRGASGPYTYSSAEPKLCLANTAQTTLSASAAPDGDGELPGRGDRQPGPQAGRQRPCGRRRGGRRARRDRAGTGPGRAERDGADDRAAARSSCPPTPSRPRGRSPRR